MSWNGDGIAVSPIAAVTLHVSVWVEIVMKHQSTMFYFVTLHVSVWVEIQGKADRVYQYRSRSTWACELKYQKPLMNRWWTLSRSTWACELKLSYYEINLNLAKVTLHVSVWVEIWPHCRLPETKEVTLHVSVWVEMKQLSMLLEVLSHAPRERVSWNNKSARRKYFG